MKPSEVGGKWCPTFNNLAGWVTDWSDSETTDLARTMIQDIQQFVPTNREAQFNIDASFEELKGRHCMAESS